MNLNKILEFLTSNTSNSNLEAVAGIIAGAVAGLIALLIPLVKNGTLKLILELALKFFKINKKSCKSKHSSRPKKTKEVKKK